MKHHPRCPTLHRSVSATLLVASVLAGHRPTYATPQGSAPATPPQAPARATTPVPGSAAAPAPANAATPAPASTTTPTPASAATPAETTTSEPAAIAGPKSSGDAPSGDAPTVPIPAPAANAQLSLAPGSVDEPEAETEIADEDSLSDLNAKLESLTTVVRNARNPTKLSGYADIGFFIPLGNNGIGVRRDANNAYFPEHSDTAWVFYGDLLATQINSRGEVASLGELAGAKRFDSVHSNGAPSFLINELNQTITSGLNRSLLFTGSVNFMPRQGREFALGDWLDVDLAQLEWQIGNSGKHSLFIGKFDSVIGHEYRARKAPQRFGVVPTLIARYTTGTATGIKFRSKLFNDHLIIAAAVTNGSFGTEQFHFFDEIDSNRGKTLSGRVAAKHVIGEVTLEAAASAQYGTQDGARTVRSHLYGFDAHVFTLRSALHLQWLRGNAPGDAFTQAYALDLRHGAYAELTHLITPRIGLLLRGELRDANTRLQTERLYITKSWRAVAALRVVLNTKLLAKFEYVHNGEYGVVPQFPNDIATSSLVISF